MIGEQLGSYRVMKKIGEGGMGIVYLAEHGLIGKRAAIKMLLPEYSHSQEIVNRFFNEARSTTAIRHPGLVDVYDFGVHTNGCAYIVMEFLEGESLSHRMRKGALPFDMAISIARQVASALHAAHQKGIVHRDLKPDNVFLVYDSEVAFGVRAKVLDFGIAKLQGDTQKSMKTRTGSVMGTPTYMSPEQCRGAGKVDHRADIYSLACMLFEMICGRPPFVGEGPGDILAAHLREAPPWPRQFVAHVPEPLEMMIVRNLSKNAAERDQSMEIVAAGLDAMVQRPITGQDLSRAAAHAATMMAMSNTPAPGSYAPPVNRTPWPGAVQQITPAPMSRSGVGPVSPSAPGFPGNPSGVMPAQTVPGRHHAVGPGSSPGIAPGAPGAPVSPGSSPGIALGAPGSSPGIALGAPGSSPGLAPIAPGSAPDLSSGRPTTLSRAASQKVGTSPPTPRSRKAILIPMIAGAVVGVGVAAYLVSRGEKGRPTPTVAANEGAPTKPAAPAEPAPPAELAPPAPTPASTTPASTTPASTTPASTTPASTTPASTPPAPPPAPQEFAIQIKSSPSAEIRRDGRRVANTPHTLRVTAGTGPIQLVLHRDGYHDRPISIDGDRDDAITVELERIEVAEKPRTEKPRTEKPKTEKPKTEKPKTEPGLIDTEWGSTPTKPKPKPKPDTSGDKPKILDPFAQ